MEDRHQKTAYPLRMPDSLRKQLQYEADIIGRSLNAEIIARLEQSFSQEQLPKINILEAIEAEVKSKGYSFTINFGEQPSISSPYEGAYRRGYHQAVAEVAYCMNAKVVTSAEQLNFWVEGSGMIWRRDMSLDRMTPPPPFVSIPETKK